jgi:hypothetical protein
LVSLGGGEMARMLWPRILYWAAFALIILGLFYAITGLNNTPGLLAQTNTQTGGATFALIGVLVLLGGKYWMDWVVRKRSQLPCAACGRKNHFTAMHCSGCGAALRVTRTQEPVPVAPMQPTIGLLCSSCGQANGAGARFCVSCGTRLAATA